MPRKVTAAELAALSTALREVAAGRDPAGAELIAAVRVLCRTLGERHPGGVLELRVPPYAAVQLGIGQRGAHTRGTPPNVVETDALTLLRLAAGTLSWPDALAGRAATASGPHTDLSEVFPLA
ncbi:MAG: sterol carrier family protein [Propionicimonas sp.]